jgi:hypothetical protein
MDDANDINRVKTYFENVDISKLKRFEFVARNEFSHQQVISSTNNLKVLDKILWQSL